MKSFLVIITFCLITPLVAGDFDGWYFEYHISPVAITGAFFTPDGEKTLTISGERTGKLSADRKSFEEISAYKYEPGNNKAAQSIVWKNTDKDGVFTGSSRDPNGIQITYRMTIVDKASLTIESKSVDGRILVERGKLDPDGKIHVSGTMRSKAGEAMFEVKYVLSKAAKK